MSIQQESFAFIQHGSKKV